MNVTDLIKSMGSMGTMFSEKNFNDILDYCSLMLYDERVVMVNENDKPVAFIFYAITDDPDKYLKKGSYEYIPHDISGKAVYVEKLVSFTWNRDLRMLFERIIIEKYPQIEYGVWYRAKKWGDQKVVTRRRIECTKSKS